MKIVLATPLYPPDIAEPAPYIKELARRLSSTHEVTVVAYGHIPEAVPGVYIRVVSKHRPLPLRLISFTFALLRETRGANVLYFENGPSVELPVSIVSFLVRARIFMHQGDAAAHERTRAHPWLRRIESFARMRARDAITDLPPERPEVLPFGVPPTGELDAFENTWSAHVALLERLFSHA